MWPQAGDLALVLGGYRGLMVFDYDLGAGPSKPFLTAVARADILPGRRVLAAPARELTRTMVVGRNRVEAMNWRLVGRTRRGIPDDGSTLNLIVELTNRAAYQQLRWHECVYEPGARLQVFLLPGGES